MSQGVLGPNMTSEIHKKGYVKLKQPKKAFDKLSHQRLACKAEQYGIKWKIANLIESFLGSRIQPFVINGESLECNKVTSEIPYGMS